MIAFHKNYFLYFILLLFVEVMIALFVNDQIIRPFVGDFLVVILLYCLVKAFFKTSINSTAIGVLIFAYIVEGLQYLHIAKLLGLQNEKISIPVPEPADVRHEPGDRGTDVGLQMLVVIPGERADAVVTRFDLMNRWLKTTATAALMPSECE